MSIKQNEISEEMYRRLYRLIKRQVDPRSIAATLNIPLRTVEGIVARFGKASGDLPADQASVENSEDKGFLDIYVYTKTRYVIIQLVGTLTTSFCENLTKELDKAHSSSLKAFAIKMSDVTFIDEKTCKVLQQYFEKFQSFGRYLALLDPSQEVEALLVKHNLDVVLPVFGTERAFEDAAFSRKSSTVIKRSSS